MSDVKTSLVGNGPSSSIVGDNSQAPAPTEAQQEQKATAPVEISKTSEPGLGTDPQFASKFAALTRKEKAIREQQAALKSQQSEIDNLKKQFEDRGKTEVTLADRIKKEPLKVLSEMGLTFEDLSQIVLNEGNPTPEMLIKRTRDELQSEYKKELEDLKTSLLEKEKKSEEDKVNAVKSQYLEQLTEYVNSNEKYELIRHNDAVQLVYDVVEGFYEEKGEVLSIEQAADQVESYLETEAKRIFELKKFKQTSQTKEQPSAGEAKKEAAPTLSNALATQASNQGERYLSDEESKREAAKLIRWTS